MIPYSTCMRFSNTRRHSLQNDKFSPSEWTLVQHFGLNARVDSTIINVTSQDDQTLCFTWAIESQNNQPAILGVKNPSLLKERSQSDELDRRSVYLLLALRRRKSLQQSIHPETIPLLDPYYYGISQRYLKYSYKWNFNTFSFDVLTSGHSLSSLLLYLFQEYGFIETFNLDLINVLRCFHYLEKGYHDTNPYHNSVHAADVTQAMHCFLQESKIKQHLTPFEVMCSLFAAASHDLDHPGVNQNFLIASDQFLIATNTHLRTMPNNLSVLESHHWRFALSCFYESHIFDHFDEKQWKEIKFLLKHLILATDISRQNDYIQQFHSYLKLGEEFQLDKQEHKYFILQIALKCADLGNPCRPWQISRRWSELICSEFYRQGDFEKLLGLPVTPMCDRSSTTISKTQTDFFKSIVRPLFELWNTYLDSKLTRQLINNLNFNEYMWQNMDAKCARIKHSCSLDNIVKVCLADSEGSARYRSFSKLPSIPSIEEFKQKLPTRKDDSREMSKKCINGCGTPTCSTYKDETNTSSDAKSSKLDDGGDFDEDDDFISDFNCGAILSTPALILPNFCFEKPQSGFYRRGSAPGCIDLRRNDLSSAKGTALLLLCNTLKANHNVKRRSSFPNVKISKANLHYNASLQSNINTMNSRFNVTKNRSLSNRNRNNRFDYYQTSCRSSLYDRRSSVPQDIFIRSLNNYTA